MRKSNDRKKNDKELTAVEREIMLILWRKQPAVIHDIIEEMPDPKPAYTTVSTTVRILEQKGIVSHNAYGKTYQYYALMSKEEYSHTQMQRFNSKFFDGSFAHMVSFFAQREQLSDKERQEIIELLNSGK